MSNLPRDTFLYLAAIITLVVSAVGFGMLIFNYVDFYFPDPVADYFHFSDSGNQVRQAMAMLIVVFPAFFWISRFLRKDTQLHPEKKELKIRKWLLYLTLFAASLVIIGDLVTVINNFLKGELTIRFALKALTIFFIAGSASYYYLAQLREKGVKWIKLFSWVISAVIIFSVVWGFVVIGSPFEQRAKRFDEKRVEDLSTIQSQIINHWQKKELLPKKLSDLADSVSGFFVPLDPETGSEYEYNVIEKTRFQLCAIFNSSSLSNSRFKQQTPAAAPKPLVREYYPYDNWQHDAGKYCFMRIIDPELYPPLKTINSKF